MSSRRSKTKRKSPKRKGLSRLLWVDQTRRAKIIIGAKPGKKQCWRSKRNAERCLSMPATIRAAAIKELLVEMRAQQVGQGNVNLTRYRTRGFFEGGEEPSYVYDVIDDSSSGTKFKKHMRQLAEGLSKAFCQDSVLVEYVDPDGATTTKGYVANTCKEPGSKYDRLARERAKRRRPAGTQGIGRRRTR